MTNEMANNETPSQYLETHDLTRKLASLGVTDEQRQAMRFRKTNKGWPFSQWTFEWLANTPREATSLIKSYCALKWLILEHPCDSRDKEDAWQLVSETMIAPVVAIGLRAKEAQSKRAKKPRGSITTGGEALCQLIGRLAQEPQYRTETAKELWPRFFAVLEEQELYPIEIEDPTNLRKCAYGYDFKDGQKKITFGRFANIVSAVRSARKITIAGLAISGQYAPTMSRVFTLGACLGANYGQEPSP